ncbi:enoyl-CoA hydratase/isomerase family protein, partial [Mycobacterium sp.]|uniref:enoyl-CoA hydratase/isomerase family protein n=1 Tax=Mycobacterium sp. TaxID=1785 RepID=UPI003A886AF0
EVPVIGVIGGATMGGALELASACDWRIAADSATFAMPAARLGVVYAPEGLRRFISLLGPARTRQLFLGGARIDAARAFAIGLVDDLVPADRLWAVARAAATDVLRGAPGAVAGTRAAIAAITGPLDDLVRANIGVIRETAYRSDEFREGLAAFHERRDPGWASPNPEPPPD